MKRHFVPFSSAQNEAPMAIKFNYKRCHRMHVLESILKRFTKPARTSTTYLIGPLDL